jgi:hypothetical protein
MPQSLKVVVRTRKTPSPDGRLLVTMVQILLALHFARLHGGPRFYYSAHPRYLTGSGSRPTGGGPFSSLGLSAPLNPPQQLVAAQPASQTRHMTFPHDECGSASASGLEAIVCGSNVPYPCRPPIKAGICVLERAICL